MITDKISFSVIVPTISRPSLARALESIRKQTFEDGDELILIGDGPGNEFARDLFQQFGIPGRYFETPLRSGDWGHTPRNLFHHVAAGSHLMALDDDDQLDVNAFAMARKVIGLNPRRPHIFKMTNAPIVGDVWKVPQLTEGNVGTPMLVTPNDPAKIGKYAERYGGDFDFIRDTCGHYPEGPIWRPETICHIRPRRRP